MNLRNKAKLFWWIYTISDLAIAAFSFLVTLSMAQVTAEDNTLLTPYDIAFKVQIVRFLFFMLYRIVILYKVEKRMVPMVMGIILVLAFVLNNIPSIGGSISVVVNALTLVLWIYDIKLIFLDEKDKSSEATEN